MIKLDRNLAVFDLETTGLESTTDRIIQFGCIVYDPNGLLVDRVSELINPGVGIPAMITELTGITDEAVAGAPRFETVAPKLHQLLSGVHLAGYNCTNFDIPFLWEEFHRAGINWDINGVLVFDAKNIFTKKSPRTLVAALKHFCGKDHTEAHDAMADVIATKEVLDGELAAYPDLAAMTPQELSDFCVADELDRKPVKRIDLAGVLVRDSDGVARYTHKKVRGVAVKDDPGYAAWILRSNFSANTKQAVEAVLREINQ